MKKLACVFLILMLAGGARAEVYLPDFSLTAQTASGVSGAWGDAFLTAWETAEPAEKDVYYHSTEDCPGLEGRVADPGADAPCPVCVSTDCGDSIAAVVRGGTVIVRIPEAWMEKQSGFTRAFFGTTSREYTGEEAGKSLSADLRGQAYADFLREWQTTGAAKAVTWGANIECGEKILKMNERHIGNARYFVLRPSGKVKDSLKVSLSLLRRSAEAEGDVLRLSNDSEWDGKYTLKITRDDAEAAFTGEYDGCRLTLYETKLGVYAAVVYKYDADEADLFYLNLTVGDREAVVMNGYMSGDKGVYCGVLTEGEARLIMDGENVEIRNAPWF